ncbi:MAG: tetratricopeptide repeat protein [Deinococcota bacterium]
MLVFGIYRAEADIDAVKEHLIQSTDLHIQTHNITAEQAQPLLFLRDLPVEPRQVIFSVYHGNLEDDLSTLAQNLNVQRELLNQVNHALVMWFREESFARFVRQAPDFWAWHSATFDFQSPVPGRIDEAMVEIEQLERPDFKNRPHLEHRAQTYRDMLAAYTNPTEQDISYLLRTRLRLVKTLFDLTDYEEALPIAILVAQQAQEYELTELFAEAKDWEGLVASNLGKQENALVAAQEAVAIYRELAASHPDVFLPRLAASVGNSGNSFNALGQYEDALIATQEVVAIYRELAVSFPDNLRGLARSLNNLSITLSNLDKHEDALAAAQEVIPIYRKLVVDHPDRFLPELASALNNLGIRLSHLEQNEDALVATQEAVAIRHDLAADRPDVFLPKLAISVDNLSDRFSDLEQNESSLAATQEAVTIYRELTAAYSDTFLSGLALSLTSLGMKLSAFGRNEEALAATQEAVTIYRKIVATHSDTFLPALAVSLSAFAQALENVNQLSDAIQAYCKSFKILSSISYSLPSAFVLFINISVENYVKLCETIGERPDIALLAPIEKLLQSLDT